jgi:uncharacterized membrane protein
MTQKSIFGLNENIAAALSYIFVAFSGVVVLILERENKFVRFHALQSTLFFLFIMVATAIVNFILRIPILGWLLGIVLNPAMWLVGLATFLIALFLIVQALNGKTYKLPIFGEVAWGQIFK